MFKSSCYIETLVTDQEKATEAQGLFQTGASSIRGRKRAPLFFL